MTLTGKNFIASILICFAYLLPKALAAPDSEALKESTQLWLGSEQGRIVFKNTAELRPHSKGQLLILKPHKSKVELNEIWAVFNPDQLITEQKSLELEHQKHDLLLEEKAKPIATKKTKSQLFELRSERYDLEQSLLSDGLSKDLKKQIKQGLEMIDLKIDEHQRGDQQKEAKLLVDLELKASEISLEKQTKAYQTLLYDSEYKAPFSGVIEFSGEFLELHPDPEQKTIWVNANLNLGRLTDQSQSYIKLESSRAFWNQIPPSQLILSIADPRKGTRHKAPYSHSATGSLPNKNSKAHYFLLENHFLSPDEISSEQLYLVDVFRSFDHPKPIIPKKKLLSKDPDLLKHEGWAGLVEKFHPSYKIFQIGPEAIALELKEP